MSINLGKRKALLFIIIILLEPWLISILYCEALTIQFANNELLQTVSEYIGENDLDQIKILEYKELSYCKVYAKNNNGGHLFLLLYNMIDSIPEWKVVYWHTVWAKQGSADEFIWPYFR